MSESFFFLGNLSFGGFPQPDQYVAIELAKRGFEVHYIEGMPSFAAALRNIVRKRWNSLSTDKVVGSETLPSQLRIHTPPMVPTSFCSSLVPPIDHVIFKRWFELRFFKHDWEKTTVVTCLPYWLTGFIDLDEIKPKRVVYYKTDLLKVPSLDLRSYQRMLAGERELIRHSTHLFATAAGLLRSEGIQSQNAKCELLPNAVDDHFLELTRRTNNIVRCRNQVVFVGSMDERRFDSNLVGFAAQSIPDAEFHLFGTASRAMVYRLSSHRNIHFHRALSRVEMASVLREAAVAIIPFRINEISDNMNPLKMYEYASAKLAIVGTATQELLRYPDVISLSQNHDEFVANIKCHLKTPVDEHGNQLRQFAEENSWSIRVTQLLDALGIGRP